MSDTTAPSQLCMFQIDKELDCRSCHSTCIKSGKTFWLDWFHSSEEQFHNSAFHCWLESSLTSWLIQNQIKLWTGMPSTSTADGTSPSLYLVPFVPWWGVTPSTWWVKRLPDHSDTISSIFCWTKMSDFTMITNLESFWVDWAETLRLFRVVWEQTWAWQ